jgi:phosphopantothenoylcysteine decarboxylase
MNILLGVTGSVAATLTKKMVMALKSLGSVQVVMTENGRYFASSKLAYWKHSLVDDEHHDTVKTWHDNDEWFKRDENCSFTNEAVWREKGDPVRHIDLAKWANVLVIAPLTANTLAKMTNGICDNLLTCIYRAWGIAKPIVVAPAMNTMMWESPITKRQMAELRLEGVTTVGPVAKELACGDIGMGAMDSIKNIVDTVKKACE